MASSPLIPFAPATLARPQLRVCDLVQFHSPISGGVKRFIADKCRFLARRPEIEHMVIVPGAEDGTDRWHNSTLHFVHSPRLIGSASYRVLHDRRRIGDILRRFHPDVIEVGDPYITAWIARRFARELGSALVGFYHSDYPRAWHRTVQRFAGRVAGTAFERVITSYLRMLYCRMDAFVVASRRLEQTWLERGLAHCLRVIPLGTDPDVFRPQHAERARVRREWAVPEEAPVLLYAGRLAREKRLDWLLRCHARVAKKLPATRLLFVGDGEWRPRVQAWARQDPRIRWQPYTTSPRALAEVCSAADVFVHAGMGETFGLSLLEAQACGLPVVAAQDSGMDETVLDVPGNALVPPEAAEAWGDAVLAALRASAPPVLRAARHEAVQRQFSSAQTYARLAALYRELADRGSPQRQRAVG